MLPLMLKATVSCQSAASTSIECAEISATQRALHLQPEHSCSFLPLATQERAEQPGRAQRREQLANDSCRRGGCDFLRRGNSTPCAAAATSGTMNSTSGVACAISHQELRYSSKPSAKLQTGPLLTDAARADKLMPARELQLRFVWLSAS